MVWVFISVAWAAPAQPVASVEGANLQRPCWSPDGKLLSFEANFHDEKRIELYVGEARDGGFQRIQAKSRGTTTLTQGFQTRPSSGQVAHELSFAPSTIGAYVFAASNDLFDYDLYISEGTSVAAGPGADGGARWSPDGNYIAFTSARTGEGDLYLLDTKHIETAPRRLTSQAGSSELYVDWAPDGKSLVYVAHSDAGDNLWFLPSLTAQPARLTAWAGNQIRPRFSPKGGLVAFYANHDNSERFDLYVINTTTIHVGAAPRLVARGVYPDAHGPAWTKDGTHIIYVSENDSEYDPVRAVRVDDPSKATTLNLTTVGNGDLDLAVRDGQTWIAVVAQGLQNDTTRDFKRLYVAQLPPLP
jgi:Tol biopolymer transport system component